MAPIGVYFMQACSSVSFVASACILITILRVRLFHKLFVKIIFFISLSDCLASLALMFGGTRSESPECYLQGITSNYFVMASICWSAIICLQVHSVVIYGKVQNYMTLFYIFCWGFPLIVTLVPISTSTYGNDEGTPGWCWVANGYNYPDWTMIMWFFLGFYLWIWILIGYMIYVLVIIWHKFYIEQKGINPQAPVVVRRILGYPTIVVFCWTLPSVLDISVSFGANMSKGVEPLLIFAYVLPTIQGFLTALVFFAANRDLAMLMSSSQTRDTDLIAPLGTTSSHQDEDVPTSTNFSEASNYSTSDFSNTVDHYGNNQQSFFERASYEVPPVSFSSNPIHSNKDVENRGTVTDGRATVGNKNSSMTSFEVDFQSSGSTPEQSPSSSTIASRKHHSLRRRQSDYEATDSILSTNAY